MKKRWITGQEIIDEFALQPFELRDILAATKEGKTPTGQDVGYAAYLVQLNETYPITKQHTEIARRIPCVLRAHDKLEEIDKQRDAETAYQQDGEKLHLHAGNCLPLDDRIGTYYALTPEKYKTESGIDIEGFYKDLPTFVFSEDEYATIKKILEDEGVVPEEDVHAPAAGVREAPTVAAAPPCPSTNKELALDIEECREIARLIWSSDPEKRIAPVAKEIASGTHVVGQPCKWLDGQKSADAVRKWITGLCPNPRPGRPRKNP